MCRPGQGCLSRASQLARDVLSPSASQLARDVSLVLRRRSLRGSVDESLVAWEGVVSLPSLRCVASVVPTKLLDFTSHWIIMEHDQETIVAMTFLYFENDLKQIKDVQSEVRHTSN